ncbi:MAG: hypothetical protein KatS3mg051_2008 [Anaerolineae bacterium]|nr:MAG: hypothetical protein KatS3mg051_2008 [Anaerolineae bacterium]
MQVDSRQVLNHQIKRAGAVWLILAFIWIPVRFFALSDDMAYVLLPGMMASPFLLFWALVETLTLARAYWRRSALQREQLSRWRLQSVLVCIVISWLLIAYGAWRDERALNDWYENQVHTR